MAITESYTGYCLSCLRDHLHKVKGVLREAEKQWRRKGEVTESIRNKVELAEEELSSAETEHVWNVQLKDPVENRRLKQIGSKISNIRKVLESTQIGFPHPNIPVKGTVEDLGKVQEQIDSAMEDVYEGITECKSCLNIKDFLKQVKTLKPEPKRAKILNTSNNNSSLREKNMQNKDLALMYAGQWAGKGIDKAIQYTVPQYDMPITLGLAVGLPLLTRFVKMPEAAEKTAILVGGFLSTKIVDYVEGALAPATAVAVPRPTAYQRPVIVTPTPVPARAQTKYVIT